MGSLADALAVTAAESSSSAFTRKRHPQGWEPGVLFDPETQAPTVITTPAVPKLDAAEYASIVESMGVPIPAGHELRLIAASFDPVAWVRDTEFVTHPDSEKQIKRPATTRPAWRYRFAVVRAEAFVTLDALAELGRLKRTKKARVMFTGPSSFMVGDNDWQDGKVVEVNGQRRGTPDLLERLDRYFDATLERARHIGKHRLGEVVILAAGDLVEGCFIYPNQSHSLDRNRREQIRDVSDLLVDQLDRYTALFPRVRVIGVGGNHGENRFEGKRIDRSDNADLEAIENAARTVSRDKRMADVRFLIAQEQPALTTEIQGHVYAVTHGHVYGKKKGATPDQKAFEWYKNQAAAHAPVGDASVLYGAHFHHDIVKRFGRFLFVQGPAADNGSPEFADYSGEESPAGMATWVVTERSPFTEYEVVR